MNCGINFVKYMLFIFNFIFTLCGLALLIVGVLTHLKVKHVAEILEDNITFPSIGLIIVGAIIFIIAFFGCCGAVRENHCMIITFAMLMLTILVIQIAVGIYAFVNLKDIGQDQFKKPYTKTFEQYYQNPDDREIIDFVQSGGQCCGLRDYHDFETILHNNTIPWSCCEQDGDSKKPCNTSQIYQDGCLSKLVEIFKAVGVLVGAIAIGVAAVEFIGIVFALCLANSIRNAERRGYRV